MPMPRPDFSVIKANIREAKRAALVAHALDNPKLTLGDLIKAGAELGTDAKAITVAELTGNKKASQISRRAPAPATKTNTKGRRRRARPKDEIAKYEAAVLASVESAGGPVGAEALRKKVGGDPDHLRSALKRWTSARKIKRKGKARATTYTAK